MTQLISSQAATVVRKRFGNRFITVSGVFSSKSPESQIVVVGSSGYTARFLFGAIDECHSVEEGHEGADMVTDFVTAIDILAQCAPMDEDGDAFIHLLRNQPATLPPEAVQWCKSISNWAYAITGENPYIRMYVYRDPVGGPWLALDIFSTARPREDVCMSFYVGSANCFESPIENQLDAALATPGMAIEAVSRMLDQFFDEESNTCRVYLAQE